MIAIKRNRLVSGEKLDMNVFSLPVGGCTITTVEWLPAQEYCRVKGEIAPVDPTAEAIEFQVNLPYNWNRKTIHYGGGGFDGVLVTAEESLVGQKMQGQTPPASGYVTFGSDSGHKEKGPWDASFSWNDEMLYNFAHQQLKKTYDAAMQIIEKVYGAKPQYRYFAGGSNGGREALKVAQNYPEDYDGILCFFPVLNWVEKAVKDVQNANFMQQMGEKGLIPAEQFVMFRKKVLEICGREDGLIHDLDHALEMGDQVRAEAAKILSGEQMQVLDQFSRPLVLKEAFANGVKEVPQYLPYAGTPLAMKEDPFVWRQLLASADKRDGSMTMFGDAVLRYQVLRGKEEYNPMTFSIEEHQEQLEWAANLLDATNPDLKAFHDHGGKMILVHGLADQLVTPLSTIAYYERLKEEWSRQELDAFCRFYLIPGYGHGMGEDFMMGTSIVEMLDEWVTLGQAPEEFIASDQIAEHAGKVLEISRYTR